MKGSPLHVCALHAGNCNGDAPCRDDFYSDPVAVGYYKDHVRSIITRVNTFNGRVYRQGLQHHNLTDPNELQHVQRRTSPCLLDNSEHS